MAVPSQATPARGGHSAGDRKGGRAIPYDFKHPNRVSKDQIRKIETIHDGFASTLATSLSTAQRSLVDVHLVAVDQITYTEFVTSLRSPSCSYTFHMSPLDGTCVLDVDLSLALAILDRMFGGRGAPIAARRELTRLERTVMQRIAARILDQLAESWHRIMDATATIVGLESNPQFLQAAPPGETVIAITLQLSMAASGGCVRICYPHVMLEGVLARLSTQSWAERTRRGRAQTDRASILNLIRPVAVTLDGQLAETQIPLGKLMEIEPGTIIPLALRVGEAVTLRVAGEKKFAGTLGTVGRRRAVRIEGPLQSEGG